jgi:hypothetical protein
VGALGSSFTLCRARRYSCSSACAADIRFDGSKTSIFSSRSMAAGLACGYRAPKGTLGFLGSALMYLTAFGFSMIAKSDADGSPSVSMTRRSCCKGFMLANNAFLPRHSARMQPTDQMSMPESYVWLPTSSSGDSYQRVTTPGVQVSGVAKSLIFKSQFLFTSKLLGLRLWCSTLAE